jgi:hypothetical protein
VIKADREARAGREGFLRREHHQSLAILGLVRRPVHRPVQLLPGSTPRQGDLPHRDLLAIDEIEVTARAELPLDGFEIDLDLRARDVG